MKIIADSELPGVEPDINAAEIQVLREFRYPRFVIGTVTQKKLRSPAVQSKHRELEERLP